MSDVEVLVETYAEALAINDYEQVSICLRDFAARGIPATTVYAGVDRYPEYCTSGHDWKRAS